MNDRNRSSDVAHYSELSYLRGVHQALYTAYRMAMKATTVEESRRIIGFAVDAAEGYRDAGEWSLCLLDDIAGDAYKRLRSGAAE